jgi:hypothetical protein
MSMGESKNPELVRLEAALAEAESELKAAEDRVCECECAFNNAASALDKLRDQMRMSGPPGVFFGMGVIVDKLPCCVLSFHKGTLEVVADGPAGFFEMKLKYDPGSERVMSMDFHDGVELFERFRKAGRI